MQRSELQQYLQEFLQVDKFRDYAPNGLQVEGKSEINRIVTGVTACQSLIDAAIACQADAILVHHGFFWKSEPQVLVGMKQRRIKSLLVNDINLFGYHLPLDAHPQVGNNITLAVQLGLQEAAPVSSLPQELLWRGYLPHSMSPERFAEWIAAKLGRKPLHLPAPRKDIRTVAWCTGGAQDYIDQAYELGVDAFISGEVSERTFHSAAEQGIHYYAAGHHATELYGIQALGAHLAQQFGLEHTFIDIANPV
ncbi:Nif3-like dinuclear metal center hexameric protein [Shewanella sp. A32]|uniref:Nif3-like dinuclear metal center hexameric protein n=1 Tax=Shewanella sp. A32 TaxID=3031327 RepID=UPI0023B9AE20|nr:Nif3-like dinuclear metal center hexameric protein [Shewanella sp. A32]MDF0535268.1 Nif3-like dinuclear metal center hexameric protein [Shewanella sp. A32]